MPSTNFQTKLLKGLFLVVSCFEAVAGPMVDSSKPTLPDADLWPQGRYVYEKNCQVCHGAFGDGKGELGRTLKPPPRNFSKGVFKYRSTPTGKLPTNADLQRTIRNGLSGTAMPVFGHLPDREIALVAEYLKSFSARWNKPENYELPIAIPKPPFWTSDTSAENTARVEKGRDLFLSYCSSCHAPDGSGENAPVNNLEDSAGQLVIPTDLRLPNLRSGPELADIYRVLLTGIESTPMPSFAESTSEEQRWELVAFISRLRFRGSSNK